MQGSAELLLMLERLLCSVAYTRWTVGLSRPQVQPGQYPLAMRLLLCSVVI